MCNLCFALDRRLKFDLHPFNSFGFTKDWTFWSLFRLWNNTSHKSFQNVFPLGFEIILRANPYETFFLWVPKHPFESFGFGPFNLSHIWFFPKWTFLKHLFFGLRNIILPKSFRSTFCFGSETTLRIFWCRTFFNHIYVSSQKRTFPKQFLVRMNDHHPMKFKSNLHRWCLSSVYLVFFCNSPPSYTLNWLKHYSFSLLWRIIGIKINKF